MNSFKNIINKIMKFTDNEKIGYFYIILVSVLYSSVDFNNTFPYSGGWFVNYVQLIDNGKYPYRDFYYYLPPLNLIIGDCESFSVN